MISNRCTRKSLVTNCNSIISKNDLRFLVDSNDIIYLCSALVYPMRFFDTLYFKILRIITSGILELNGIVN